MCVGASVLDSPHPNLRHQAGVSDEVVAAYRLPQLVRGWEAGLVRFLLARVTDTRAFGSRVAAAFHGREHLTQIERLVDVVAKYRIPVRLSKRATRSEALDWSHISGLTDWAYCLRRRTQISHAVITRAATCASPLPCLLTCVRLAPVHHHNIVQHARGLMSLRRCGFVPRLLVDQPPVEA